MSLWNGNLDGNNVTDALNATKKVASLSNITDESILYPLALVIPTTVIYAVIFFTGVVGNVSTCVVIARNKSLHTATNYFLFSLAISDLLLLVSGLPPEMYRLWSPEIYVFGEAFCVLQGFAAETSANATVLTITAFTIERYFAICHPFLSHTMSKLSRAIKYIIVIWIAALCLAAPQAIQFGVEYEFKNGAQFSRCTVVTSDFFFDHAFEISTFLFFVGPMTLITVLYVLIAVRLRKSRTLSLSKRPSVVGGEPGTARASRTTAAQNRVVKMLVAVVVAFFICWAPFHAQRLLAVYLASASPEAQQMSITIYIALMYTSGVLYFVSTTINPLLYHIMSNKFREAFKTTLVQLCNRKANRQSNSRRYSTISKCPPSLRAFKRSMSDGVQHVSEKKIPFINPDCPTTISPNSDGLEFTEHLKDVPKCQTTASDAYCVNKVFRPRMLSESSQATIVTTLSKSTSTDVKNFNRHCANLARSVSTVNSKSERDTAYQRVRKKNVKNGENSKSFRFNMFRIFHNRQINRKEAFIRHSSVESGNSTNTISNSSLQDLDEHEFSSSDLVQYMREVNDDLA